METTMADGDVAETQQASTTHKLFFQPNTREMGEFLQNIAETMATGESVSMEIINPRCPIVTQEQSPKAWTRWGIAEDMGDACDPTAGEPISLYIQGEVTTVASCYFYGWRTYVDVCGRAGFDCTLADTAPDASPTPLARIILTKR